ncbi:MAG: hypothetical protein ACRDNS_27055, partial [Trebonia sp.]
MRLLSPSKACVTVDRPRFGLTVGAEAAPAPLACAAGSGPPGDLELVSALGIWGFSMAVDGATGLNPEMPVAEAASRAAWETVPNA